MIHDGNLGKAVQKLFLKEEQSSFDRDLFLQAINILLTDSSDRLQFGSFDLNLAHFKAIFFNSSNSFDKLLFAFINLNLLKFIKITLILIYINCFKCFWKWLGVEFVPNCRWQVLWSKHSKQVDLYKIWIWILLFNLITIIYIITFSVFLLFTKFVVVLFKSFTINIKFC